MTSRPAADRLRHHVRRPVARTPYLWDLAMLVREDKRRTLARRDTALVIEGFLRSGNTYAVAAFTIANGTGPHVARHLHGAPHLLRAERLGVPALLLIRSPEAAVRSYLVRRPTLTGADAAREYLDFYRTAWRARHGFVVGVFDEVVSDFGAVLDRVNARFGTAFARFDPTPENETAALELVEELNRRECQGEVVETHVGRPSAERERYKREVDAKLADPRVAPLLAEADELWQQYLELARNGTPRAT